MRLRRGNAGVCLIRKAGFEVVPCRELVEHSRAFFLTFCIIEARQSSSGLCLTLNLVAEDSLKGILGIRVQVKEWADVEKSHCEVSPHRFFFALRNYLNGLEIPLYIRSGKVYASSCEALARFEEFQRILPTVAEPVA